MADNSLRAQGDPFLPLGRSPGTCYNHPMRLPTLGTTSTDGPSADDWRWQARHAATTLAQLEARLTLTESEREGIRRTEVQGLPLSITPYYLGLCDPHDAACPIRLQCVPRAEEGVSVPGDLDDPLGEEDNEVAPHLVCRYPDRALLIATDRCALYCRYCTRSRLVGQGGGARSLRELEPAFRWLREHPEIRDVIVSGGDPLIASDNRIVSILRALAEIESVDHVRLATRAPVTLPQRIDEALARQLHEAHPALWIMTHFNHPKELTPEASRACATLVDHGLPVMNQSVLLRGVNDSRDTLVRLFRGLVKRRVRPYYLLQCDPVRGTGHLRTPLKRGLELMGQIQGHLSGIAVPKFIVDTPGGRGKVHLTPDAIVESVAGATTLRTFRNELVVYQDPPGMESRKSE